LCRLFPRCVCSDGEGWATRREQVKLAVVYVARGQERESGILANAAGSPDYEAFVGALGWPVRALAQLGGCAPSLTVRGHLNRWM
jgi:hypothetical protein